MYTLALSIVILIGACAIHFLLPYWVYYRLNAAAVRGYQAFAEAGGSVPFGGYRVETFPYPQVKYDLAHCHVHPVPFLEMWISIIVRLVVVVSGAATMVRALLVLGVLN